MAARVIPAAFGVCQFASVLYCDGNVSFGGAKVTEFTPGSADHFNNTPLRVFTVDETPWCMACEPAHRNIFGMPPIPPGLRAPAHGSPKWHAQRAANLEWARLHPPASFTKDADPVLIRLREMENARREAEKAARAVSLQSFKDEHAERGEVWDKKAKAWIRDDKALQRLREREFRAHCRAMSGAEDTSELQREPIEWRADTEVPMVPPPPSDNADVALGSGIRPGTETPRPQRTSKRGKRAAVEMPAIMPPLPPR